MSQFAYQLLKEHGFDDPHAVYPGHAVTLAFIIVKAFPTYEEAFAHKHSTAWCDAIGDFRIPGAGGNVADAMHILRHLKRRMAFNLAMAVADDRWARCDSQRGGFLGRNPEQAQNLFTRWQKGQEQADKVKPLLEACSAWWA